MAKDALVKRGTPGASLRLGVKGGGCSGVSYAIEFSDKVRDARPRLRLRWPARDRRSQVLGVTCAAHVLDYEVKLMQHGFKFLNPNEKSDCGCGESFSI